jgi:hypothetical protein
MRIDIHNHVMSGAFIEYLIGRHRLPAVGRKK